MRSAFKETNARIPLREVSAFHPLPTVLACAMFSHGPIE
jgi:hypothetical protein